MVKRVEPNMSEIEASMINILSGDEDLAAEAAIFMFEKCTVHEQIKILLSTLSSLACAVHGLESKYKTLEDWVRVKI